MLVCVFERNFFAAEISSTDVFLFEAFRDVQCDVYELVAL